MTSTTDVAPLLTTGEQNEADIKNEWNPKCTVIVVSCIVIIGLVVGITILVLLSSVISSETDNNEYIPTILLSNAASPTSYIPVIGLGTGGWSINPFNETVKPDNWSIPQSYQYALKWLSIFTDYGKENGIIRFDSANWYESYPGVATAIIEYTQNYTKLARDKIFITSKTGNKLPLGYNETLEELDIILNAFNIEYVDLLLIHWPIIWNAYNNTISSDKYCNVTDVHHSWSKCRKSTWKAFEYIFESGKAKAIGVCNFFIKHLNDTFYWNNGVDLDDETLNIKYYPSLNQIEFHPYWHPHHVVEYCQDRNILVEGYAPLGTPDLSKGYWSPLLIDHPNVLMIAEKYNKSAAQILLRNSYEEGLVINPRSSNIEHQLENINIFDFELTEQEMLQLASLKPPENRQPHICADPNQLP